MTERCTSGPASGLTDAERGGEQGWITRSQADAIGEAWRARKLTNQETVLGSGIGFHGWIEEWPDDGVRHLSWGCIVTHVADAQDIYNRLPEGTMVILR